MIPVSAKDVHEFTPGDAGEPAPVFMLRTPTLRQRAAWRRDIAAAGARFVASSELYELLRQALHETAPRNLDQLLELIDNHEAAAEGKAPLDDEVARGVRELELAMQVFTPYAELVAARAFWWEIACAQAFRHFVVGWRGVLVNDQALEFAARNGLVADAVLELVPEAWIYAAGAAAMGLLSPSSEQRKNLESPRPSPPGPAISPAAAPVIAGGATE